jgi:hypothetical protein
VLALRLGALLVHTVQTTKNRKGERCYGARRPDHLQWPAGQECGDSGKGASDKGQGENLLGAPAALGDAQRAALRDAQLTLCFPFFLGNGASLQLGLDFFGCLGSAGKKTKGLAKPCGFDLGGVVLTTPHPQRHQVNKPQCRCNQQQNRAPSA